MRALAWILISASLSSCAELSLPGEAPKSEEEVSYSFADAPIDILGSAEPTPLGKREATMSGTRFGLGGLGGLSSVGSGYGGGGPRQELDALDEEREPEPEVQALEADQSDGRWAARADNADGLFSNMRVGGLNDLKAELARDAQLSASLRAPPAPPPPRRARRSLSSRSSTRAEKRDSESAELSFESSNRLESDAIRYLSQGAPSSFWPKQGYFKNTYLGGDLSYQEELRAASRDFNRIMAREEGYAWSPEFDAPSEAGMTLSAKLSHSYSDRPQRVILQLGLKGSERYGWRRPALNLMLVVDPALLQVSADPEQRQSVLVELLKPALSRLNAADQVGLSVGGAALSPRSPEQLREALITPLEQLRPDALSTSEWSEALSVAGRALNQASADPHRAPGAQALLLLCGQGCVESSAALQRAAHQLNLDGTLTSVIDSSLEAQLGHTSSSLWQIASVGHGGYWLARGEGGVGEAIDHEFDRFSRVVARLLRLSVKLSEGVELIEVIGSELLSAQQKQRVKAREEAMDKRLSARLGIKSDRGEDDEGVQVVIPAFYGGDSHLIHLALWVTRPGELAELSLKYKDMVRAQNASDAQLVTLAASPRPTTLAQDEVLRGVSAHLIAAETIRGLSAGLNLEQLNALNTPLRGAGRHLNHAELRMFSRARLGRPRRE